MSNLINTIRGSFASRPTTALDGTVFICTDSPIQFIMKNGSWQSYLGSIPLVAPPAASTWSLINATSGTTFLDSKGGLLFNTANNSVASGSFLVAKKTPPILPYQITAHMVLDWGAGGNPSSYNFCVAGICWRETSSGNLHVFGPCYASTITGIYVNTFRFLTASGSGTSGITYGNSTDFNFTPLTSNLQNNGIWVRGIDDGVNRSIYYSGDGQNFQLQGTISRTTSITPNEVGIFVGNYTSGSQATFPTTFFTSVEVISLAVQSPSVSDTGDSVTGQPVVPKQMTTLTTRPNMPNGNIIR